PVGFPGRSMAAIARAVKPNRAIRPGEPSAPPGIMGDPERRAGRPPEAAARPSDGLEGQRTMRIIAGIRRGHTIQGPGSSQATRPTSDLVRESIFNIVGPEVDGRPVIDLFAGTGALGLEALSRGASSAT